MMIASMLLTAALAAPSQQPPAAAPSPQPEAMQATPASQPAAGSAADHIAAGLAAFKKKRFREAQGHFQQAVDADSSSAAAHFYLGYTIYKIAEPKRPFHPDKQKAAEHFAHAYQLDPNFKPDWGPRS